MRLEIIGGLLLLTISHPHLSALVGQLTQHELSEDPHDLSTDVESRQNLVISAQAPTSGMVARGNLRQSRFPRS